MPLPNPDRRRHIWRKMHMLARTPQQALLADRGHKSLGRAVKKLARRLKRNQLQIDGDRMALTRADRMSIRADGKALLILSAVIE